MRKILVIILILIVLVLAAGCVQQPTETVSKSVQENEFNKAISDVTGDVVDEQETVDIGEVI